MTLLQAVCLGAAQGVTEFFPISSSGHLVIIQHLLGLRDPQVAFDVFLHIGTLVSVVLFFHRDIIALFGKDRRMLMPLIAASIPTFIIGFFFKDIIEQYFGMPVFAGYMLLVTGLWLIAASVYASRTAGKKTVQVPGLAGSLLVGTAQGIAILPGVSRSGATIATGMLAGIEKEAACRFSFLLSIPAVAGASVLKIGKIGAGLTSAHALQFAAGGLVATVVGIISIALLLKIVNRGRLWIFGIYCFLAGVLIIIML